MKNAAICTVWVLAILLGLSIWHHNYYVCQLHGLGEGSCLGR